MIQPHSLNGKPSQLVAPFAFGGHAYVVCYPGVVPVEQPAYRDGTKYGSHRKENVAQPDLDIVEAVSAANNVLKRYQHGVVSHDKERHEEHEEAHVLFEDDADGGNDAGDGDPERQFLELKDGRAGRGARSATTALPIATVELLPVLCKARRAIGAA